MNLFHLYFNLGVHHIINFEAYDHILFIITLVAVYQLRHWKKIIILVTAFTIGHTTTLALATLGIVHVPTDLVEFLIAVTIFLTSITNLLQKSDKFSRSVHLFKYSLALFFGLIHGLGFSTYLRSLLGTASSIVLPLFSFNLGVETGQLMLVLLIILSNYLLIRFFSMKQHNWKLVLSGAGMGVSIILMGSRWPF
jgi:hypothetical protein